MNHFHFAIFSTFVILASLIGNVQQTVCTLCDTFFQHLCTLFRLLASNRQRFIILFGLFQGSVQCRDFLVLSIVLFFEVGVKYFLVVFSVIRCGDELFVSEIDGGLSGCGLFERVLQFGFEFDNSHFQSGLDLTEMVKLVFRILESFAWERLD